MTGAPPLLHETASAFDRRSATYDDSRMHHAMAARAAEAADADAGTTLLDVAGGTGLVARACLARLGSAGRAVVLDVSAGMLAAGRRAEPRLVAVRADAHRVPLPDCSVDRVTCVTALHLLADPLRALQQAVRVCAPGGRVVFTTWQEQAWTATELLRAACAPEGLRLVDPNAGSTPDAARAMGLAAGLVDVTVTRERHDEPLLDREPVWGAALAAAPAAALRAVPEPVKRRMQRRFERALADTPAIRHALLLVAGEVPRRGAP